MRRASATACVGGALAGIPDTTAEETRADDFYVAHRQARDELTELIASLDARAGCGRGRLRHARRWRRPWPVTGSREPSSSAPRLSMRTPSRRPPTRPARSLPTHSPTARCGQPPGVLPQIRSPACPEPTDSSERRLGSRPSPTVSRTNRAGRASSRRTRARGSRARPPRRRPGEPDSVPATASSSSRWLASGSCSPVISPSTTRGRPRPADHQVGPARSRRDRAVGLGRQSPERARPSFRPRPRGRQQREWLLTSRAVGSGTSNRSGAGGSCFSGDDRPVCNVSGATATPRIDQSRQQPVGERAPGRRHLGAARLVGVHGLHVATTANDLARSRSGWAGRGRSDARSG